MKENRIFKAAPWALAALLAACGGGGGGSGASAPSTAINAMVAPANFDFATVKPQVIHATLVLQAVGGFTSTNATLTYVTVWYTDAAGKRQQLTFISLAALQALGTSGVTVQVPGNIHTLSVEIYQGSVSKTGSISI